MTIDATSTATENESLTAESLGLNIRRLGDLLGEVIQEQAGSRVFEMEEELRKLCKESRQANPDRIEPEYRERIKTMVAELVKDLDLTTNVLKSFSTYFALINLAEEHQRIEVLRDRAEACVGGEPMDESIGQAIETLAREGVDANQMAEILQQMLIMPVFTAHPTESKRRTTRQILNYLSEKLAALESPATRTYEYEKLTQDLKGAITLLWQSDDRRKRKLTVMDEVRNTGLYFFQQTLFEVVPEIYRALEKALQRKFPETDWEIPAVLRYGSWIGGDRDGNPFVTVDTTESALRAQKSVVLERYESDIKSLYEHLSSSRSRAGFSSELLDDLKKNLAPEGGTHRFNLNLASIERFDEEPYRQKLILMYRKLRATREHNEASWDSGECIDGSYANAAEFLNDLHLIRDSLKQNRGEILTRGRLKDLIRRVQVFGFHLASLDIRQHSGKHEAAIGEIFSRYRLAENYAELSEDERLELLTGELSHTRPLTAKLNFADDTNKIIALFRKVQLAHQRVGELGIQTYIISMTESVSDLLEVLLLMQDADLFGKLDIVPLFETVEDLRNAPGIMQQLFEHPVYSKHLELRGRKQQIMIGYSDSNKDGGFLRANWMLFTAQRNLAETCREHDVQLTLFHGRGGSIGRGGGPANRAILAQPPESVRGRIRITEQGEVVSSRYTHSEIAFRHLQQLINAVLCSSGTRPSYGEMETWSEVMGAVSTIAENKYRDLVAHPGFLRFFQEATPIDQVGAMNLGSRPSKRRDTRGLDDLRAIPWVFAWTQVRINVPSWFGVGTAIDQWLTEKPEQAEIRLTQLREMYQKWPFLNSVLGNVHLGMGRADMGIAELYKGLVPAEIGEEIFAILQAEFDLTEKRLLEVTGHREILDTEPWLQHSIRMRSPYVDPLNYFQAELLKQLRDGESTEPEELDQILDAVAQAIGGIAAGLQNVG